MPNNSEILYLHVFNEMQLKITLLVLPLAFLLVDGTPLDQEVLYVDRGLVVDVGDGDEEGGDGEVRGAKVKSNEVRGLHKIRLGCYHMHNCWLSKKSLFSQKRATIGPTITLRIVSYAAVCTIHRQ